jgi:hypothetical protein
LNIAHMDVATGVLSNVALTTQPEMDGRVFAS